MPLRSREHPQTASVSSDLLPVVPWILKSGLGLLPLLQVIVAILVGLLVQLMFVIRMSGEASADSTQNAVPRHMTGDRAGHGATEAADGMRRRAAGGQATQGANSGEKMSHR